MLQLDDALKLIVGQTAPKLMMKDCQSETQSSSCSKYDLYITSSFFRIETMHPLNIPLVTGLLR